MWGANNDTIYFYPLPETQPGTALCDMTITMDEFPWVTSTVQFNVTTLGYIAPQIQDIDYTITEPAIVFEHSDFIIYPEGFETYLEAVVFQDAFVIASEDQLETPLDTFSLEELEPSLLVYSDNEFTIDSVDANIVYKTIQVVLCQF